MATQRRKKLPVALPDGRIETVSPAEAEKISLINSVARLKAEGQTGPEIAVSLGVSAARVKAALSDARFGIAEARARAVAADPSLSMALEVARAEYRLARAWEVLEAEMEGGGDPWIRHQAALAIVAASQRSMDGKPSTEVVIAPELAFDDQDLQSEASGGADSTDLTVIDSD